MSAKYTEHLIILHDQGEGLLNRAYGVLKFVPPKWEDADFDRLCRRLAESFPSVPDKLLKERGFDFFSKRSPKIADAYRAYYFTFVDVVHFTEKSIAMLADMAANCATLALETSAELLQLYLGLVAILPRLHVLMSRAFDAAKPILAAYARAHHTQVGSDEPRLASIAQYIETYASRPVETVRGLYEEHKISPFVGGALLPLLSVLIPLRERKTLVQGSVLSVLAGGDEVLINKHEAIHAQLLLVWPLRQHVLWGYLTCPAELAMPGAVDVLLAALSECMVVVVHRDECLDLHRVYDELFSDFQVKHLRFKLSKHKDQYREVLADAGNALQRRHDMRRYLVAEMTAMASLFKASPVALAPKAPMVLAALRLAREEVMWYFAHRTAKPYRAPARFEFPRDPHVPHLARLIFVLSDMLLAQAPDAAAVLGAQSAASLIDALPDHSDGVDTREGGVVQRYYRATLARDAADIEAALGALTATHPLAPALQRTLDDAVSGLSRVASGGSVTSATEGAGLDAFRLNAHRAAAGLVGRTSGVPLTSPLLFALTKALDAAVLHSRFADQLGALTLKHASLEQLRWWLAGAEAEVQECLSLSAGGREAISVVGMVRALTHATRNVHRVCPEELEAVGCEAMRVVDSWLRRTAQACANWLTTQVRYSGLLGTRLMPNAALQRVEWSIVHRGDLTGAPPVPGAESQFVHRPNDELTPVRGELKALTDVAHALATMPVLTVYTHVFAPREYLIAALQACVRATVRRLCVPPSLPQTQTYPAGGIAPGLPGGPGSAGVEPVQGPPTVQRPSIMLSGVERLLAELQRVDRVANIGALAIGRAVLASELTGVYPRVGGEPAGAAVLGPEHVKVDGAELADPVVTMICRWYAHVFASDLEAVHVVHSPLYRCFFSAPSQTPSSKNARPTIPLELYTDANEMRALARLLGPRGLDALHKALLAQLGKVAESLFSILAANGQTLMAVRGNYTEPLAWVAAAEALKDRERFLSLLVTAGALLHVRAATQAGMAAHADASAAGIAEAKHALASAAALAQAASGDVAGGCARTNALRALSESLGAARTVYSDTAVRDVVRRFKSSLQDAQLWALLPEMFALSMAVPNGVFTRGTYAIRLEGHTTNGHLAAVALRDLVAAAATLAPEIAPPATTTANVYRARAAAAAAQTSGADARVRVELERVLDLAAFCALNVTASTKPNPSVLAFLECFVRACGADVVPASRLEGAVPYTLLRSNYIQQYEMQADSALVAGYPPADGVDAAAM